MTNCFLLPKNAARYLLRITRKFFSTNVRVISMFLSRRAYPAILAIAGMLLWSGAASAAACPDIPGQSAGDVAGNVAGNVTLSAPGSCLSHDSIPANTTDASNDAFAKDLSHAAIYGVPESNGCRSDGSCDAEPGGKVPLPASVLLFATGLASLGLLAMRRRRPMTVPPAYDE